MAQPEEGRGSREGWAPHHGSAPSPCGVVAGRHPERPRMNREEMSQPPVRETAAPIGDTSRFQSAAQSARQPLQQVAQDPQALRMGERLFVTYCATCHGSDARGARGFPNLRDNEWLYGDAPEAIRWLCEAFGFEEQLVVSDESGGIAHAQLAFGNGMIMLGSGREDDFGKIQAPLGSPDAVVHQSAYLIIQDVDAHHDRAVAAGATVVYPPTDQEYGGRLYICRDPEGQLWSFGSYDPWAS